LTLNAKVDEGEACNNLGKNQQPLMAFCTKVDAADLQINLDYLYWPLLAYTAFFGLFGTFYKIY